MKGQINILIYLNIRSHLNIKTIPLYFVSVVLLIRYGAANLAAVKPMMQQQPGGAKPNSSYNNNNGGTAAPSKQQEQSITQVRESKSIFFLFVLI